jgi:hypothetical protein
MKNLSWLITSPDLPPNPAILQGFFCSWEFSLPPLAPKTGDFFPELVLNWMLLTWLPALM